MLDIPIRNLSRVEVHPFSVDRQLRGLLAETFESATWLGTAKGAIVVLSTFLLMDNPPFQLPRLLGTLPFLLAHVAVSIPIGFVLHLPFRLLPGAWRIKGQLFRLRFEAMDGRAFNILVQPEMKDSLIRLLRETGLMVYPYPQRATLIDRIWAVRLRGETAIQRFCAEIF